MSDLPLVGIRIDPACPWAWLTSRWLAEVERLGSVQSATRLFCLLEVNRAASPKAKPSHERAMLPLRLLVAARRGGGDPAVASLYAEIGEAVHERGEPLDDSAMLGRALDAAGLDGGLLATAADDPSTLDELVVEHEQAVAAGAFGVPTLELDGCAPVFGPIVDRRITGEAALELWEHTHWLLRHPHLYELKRTRDGKAQVGRNREATAAAR